MEGLKLKRGVIKGYITRFQTYLSKASRSKEIDVMEVESRLKGAECKYAEFEQVQFQIEEIEPDQGNIREDFDLEYFKATSAARLFIQTATKLTAESTQIVPNQGQNSGSSQESMLQVITKNIERFRLFIDEGYNENLAELEVRLQSMGAQWSKFETEHQGGVDVELENSYYKVYGIAKTILNASQSRSNSSTISSSIHATSRMKLPTISLPVFNGAYAEWLHFHDSFHSLIHSDMSLTNIQKFHYLRSSLQKEAANVIQSLEVSDDNYEIAWNLIKERFQNKKLIVHNHVKGLFELQAVSKESHVTLRELVDNAQKHLRALKALGQPTENWDTLVIYLINTKLDHITRREWEEANASSDEAPLLKDLITFLTGRCNLLETLQVNKVGSKINTNIKVPFTKPYDRTTSYVATEETNNCKVCKGAHSVHKCDELLLLNPQERTIKIKKLRLCINCLKSGHFSNQCKLRTSCRTCNKRHHTILHYNNQQAQNAMVENQNIVAKPLIQDPSTNCHSYANQSRVMDQVLLSTALLKIRDIRGNFHDCRALLDIGSQSNFVTRALCKRLGIVGTKVNIPVHGINDNLSKINRSATFSIRSNYRDFSTTISCLVLDKITECLPHCSFSSSNVQIPEGIQLADKNFASSGPIDILIGAELFWELLTNNRLKVNEDGPYFIETALGWVIGGKVGFAPQQSSDSINCNFSMANIESQLIKFWKIEGHELKSSLSPEERLCENYFQATHKRDELGRFVVRLPFRAEKSLGSSREIAEKRFRAIERKLNRNEGLRKDYSDFMKEYLALGHMELISPNEIKEPQGSFYLPHHPVIKSASLTTKLRVVFDASAKSNNNLSLNDTLMVGPTIQQDLLSIILRFRMHQFAITADISKMYRQVLVTPEHRDYQRIFWRENEAQPIQTYRLKTVTYGTAPAAFLAIRSLHQLAIDEAHDFPLAKSVILNDFYVDDLISGASSIEEARCLRDQVGMCLARGGFELRQWAANNPDILPESDGNSDNTLISLDNEGDTKALGLHWNCVTDSLKYELSDFYSEKRITKRIVLSSISKLFDPLGLISPVLISAKVIMQQLWSLKIDWDQPIPRHLYVKWMDIVREMGVINTIKIPRKVISDDVTGKVEIHSFCDASQQAYGACIYVRTIDSTGNKTVNLLVSKSRVAPLKTLSIARLELCGALLVARLAHKVSSILNRPIHKFYFWTDSTIVLSWLRSTPSTWKTFVAHRVAEIQTLSNIENWLHVDSKQNPADVISRGSSPSALISSNLWWHGPIFLIEDESAWPQQSQGSTDLEIEERRSVALSATTINLDDHITTVIERFSSFSKLQRTFAYCLRFINNCRYKLNKRSGNLSISEIQTASFALFRVVQASSFFTELAKIKTGHPILKNSRMVTLNPFLDQAGLLRVGGRLQNASIHTDKKHPILLPAKHHVTRLLVVQEHQRNLHAGSQATLAALRERYWIISGRDVVRKIIHNCMKCFRANPTSSTELMGNLPFNRVQPARPFLNTGVDYAGPVYLREKGRGKRRVKAYIALFICFAVKAIHLELVGDLTTESFLAALKRFISRRGRIANLYSDNATNFTGAQRELSELANIFNSKNFKGNLDSVLNQENISWHFIPPRSPTFGGLWESNIKCVKTHIKKILGDAAVSYEEMYTLLAQIEACLNSRPLCPLSNDPNDLNALTPGHFLIGAPLTSTLEPDLTLTPINRLSRWQRIEQLRQHFWRRWIKEYIPGLQPRTKWRSAGRHSAVCVGDMVLIREDNLPPLKWQLGRIESTHPGSDDIIRVVTIRTSSGLIKRSIHKISVLPIGDQ